MRHFNTVLGKISEEELGVTLCHEHICCYSEYLHTMAGADYLDKDTLRRAAVKYLKELKATYGLTAFLDCTPVNIGRDVDLLKSVSEQAGVHILCATGFYYPVEALVHHLGASRMAEYMITDAKKVNAGVIKCAVEKEEIGWGEETLLQAVAEAQKELHLPIVLHTNARNQNGRRALEILLGEGISPKSITVGHLSDTDDMEYLLEMAKSGCYLGLDRLYDNRSEEYIAKTVGKIRTLCEAGYADRMILSHDALFFNGFEKEPALREKPRFAYVFDCILLRLPREFTRQAMVDNPRQMLLDGETI